MSRIIEAAELPDDEKVFLKKGLFGWAVVHPVKNPDGSKNWINVLTGGWGNLFKLLFIIGVILMFLLGAKEMMESCQEFAANPCKYTKLDCSNQFENNFRLELNNEMNLT